MSISEEFSSRKADKFKLFAQTSGECGADSATSWFSRLRIQRVKSSGARRK
jgi:hypothetical protein